MGGWNIPRMGWAGVVAMLVALGGCARPAELRALEQRVRLEPGMGMLHHPVQTSDRTAQRLFDQGLTYYYASNYEAARRSFARSAELDGRLAIAWWGIAMALRDEPALDESDGARNALARAIELSKKSPAQERAYVAALSARWSDDPRTYEQAMRELARTYRHDLDAATLHAKAMTDAGHDHEEVRAALESVLRRDPNHVGACALVVQLISDSDPQAALGVASRLAQLAPAAGGLSYLSARAHCRAGDYEAAAKLARASVDADQLYLRRYPLSGIYAMRQHPRHLYLLAMSQTLRGKLTDGRETADRLAAHVAIHLHAMPELEPYAWTPLLLRLRGGQWDAILKTAPPGVDLPASQGVWHFARGIANVKMGRLDAAIAEQGYLQSVRDAVGDDHPASRFMLVAQRLLDARIAMERNDLASARRELEQAVREQEALTTSEMSFWFFPVHEALGAVLLTGGDFADAERAFEQSLQQVPRSGWSLFGLLEALRAQGKTYETQFVERQLQEAFKDAEISLRRRDLF